MPTPDEQLKLFSDNQKEFLKFLKSKFTLIHLSNLFFRDLHFGVMAYLDTNNVKLGYLESESLARSVASAFEQAKIFKKIDANTWVLNYPEFKLTPAKPAAPARPAGTAAPRPAVAPVARPAMASVPKPATSPAATVAAVPGPATSTAVSVAPVARPAPAPGSTPVQSDGEAPKN